EEEEEEEAFLRRRAAGSPPPHGPLGAVGHGPELGAEVAVGRAAVAGTAGAALRRGYAGCRWWRRGIRARGGGSGPIKEGRPRDDVRGVQVRGGPFPTRGGPSHQRQDGQEEAAGRLRGALQSCLRPAALPSRDGCHREGGAQGAGAHGGAPAARELQHE
ncbi:unnamed protein product, partial [Prorocentrum cordatum]